MTEHLRTDYDRMVGESYKEYAARMRGRMLAAEHDRDELLQQRAAVLGFLDDVNREEWASKVLTSLAIRKAYGEVE